MNWYAVVPLSVVLAAWVGARADPNAVDVADQYLAAYQRQDLDRLEELYAEHARFLDPTSTQAGLASGPVAWSGRSEILRNLRATDGTTVVLQYDILRKFEHSGVVVYVADVTYRMVSPTQVWTGTTPVITIVTVEGTRVTEHRDYTDYTTGTRNAVVEERGRTGNGAADR
ncbi:MAG: hypothetical protein DHS20C21_05130 [Gemmatimonadota bacterium]|nr:MAG: hypothetical protein DHS20C21_05130 [Gemmatimonadota bacterium]